uniref:Uncharacterized protein n=1 Tax=Pristionchus pacificus TaxID=54126 RepID=A0A2A6CRA5_PRIPA|eukprot:PDM80650.1 hypothetical protein PRIPAC_35653 [Pristionchus pacificus]
MSHNHYKCQPGSAGYSKQALLQDDSENEKDVSSFILFSYRFSAWPKWKIALGMLQEKEEELLQYEMNGRASTQMGGRKALAISGPQWLQS